MRMFIVKVFIIALFAVTANKVADHIQMSRVLVYFISACAALLGAAVHDMFEVNSIVRRFRKKFKQWEKEGRL